MMLLEQSWSRAWKNLHLQPADALYHQLVAAYNEPQRHYHSVQHLAECLAHFSECRDLAIRPGEVEVALWFHDAIYELKGADNEQRSAEWAAQALAEAGAQADVVARVKDLIMATRHDAVPTDPDQQLLVDIDLAILGATPERFSEYDQQVAQEYSWVPSIIYKTKRKEVLGGFLSRPSIYGTQYFSAKYEAQARTNLAKSVS